jgi:hypothetical protein
MHPRSYQCLRATEPPRIDGNIDKPFWSHAPWTSDFVDIEGEAKPTPTYRTRAKMLWDDENFYIAAELEEPHVWGTLTETDSVIFQDNDFEVFIDPDGDNHYYAEFEINALGTTWDLLLPKPYKDSGRPLTGWRIKGLQSAVSIDGTLNDSSDTDRRWSVELALPWASLREISSVSCPPSSGHHWRVNFSRVQWDHEVVNGAYSKFPGRAEHNWVWTPQHVVDMHRPEKWGYVQFSPSTVAEAGWTFSDPSHPVRELLHRVYYALREHLARTGSYANSCGELEMSEEVEIFATPSLFEALAEDESGGLWKITSDALISHRAP